MESTQHDKSLATIGPVVRVVEDIRAPQSPAPMHIAAHRDPGKRDRAVEELCLALSAGFLRHAVGELAVAEVSVPEHGDKHGCRQQCKHSPG